MDFNLSEEQEIFTRTFREWCDTNLIPRAREIDDTSRIPDEVIDGLASQGIFGLPFPEEYGGSGADMLTSALAIEEVARGDLSVATAVLALLQMGWGLIISRHGSEDLKREVLPRVAKGEYFVGIATTEPQGGSDIAGLTCSAVENGDTWVLNGEKLYISEIREMLERDGGYCTLVRTSPEKGHRGMTFVFVPLRSEGIQTTLIHNMGRTGLSTGGFVMKDTPVPRRYTLGEKDRGFYVAMEGFNLARVLVSAACVGCAQRALELGRAHITSRILFGRPIAKFEGVQFEYSDFATHLDAARLLVRRAAWTADRYLAGECDLHQVALASAMAKLYAPVECYRIVDGVMTWFGALGYSKECDIEMGVRGIRSYSVGAEGAQNIMRVIVARELLGKEHIPHK